MNFPNLEANRSLSIQGREKLKLITKDQESLEFSVLELNRNKTTLSKFKKRCSAKEYIQHIFAYIFIRII